ncbi:MAG: squalene/phytoene synthase family protein, partial [Planctomycetales bacterium]|nr:squalene/phytoene synthase family protein [Planctomycetales bacterium]
GLMTIHVFGFDGPAALPLAEKTGIAFQLTNILRDLREDVLRGRIYLPREDLDRFGYSADDLALGVADDRFRNLMQFEVARAREHYSAARSLFDYLDAPGQPILDAMLQIYGGLLDEIERSGYDVFSRRVSLSRYRKWSITLGVWWRNRWRQRGSQTTGAGK